MRSEMLVINHFGMDIKNVLFERKKIKKRAREFLP